MLRGNFKTLRFSDRDAWLGGRRTRIGSSEIAGILGMGYADQTPYTIWLEKVTGKQVPKDKGWDKLMAIGQAAEPFLRECFRIHTGMECHFDELPTVRINDEFPAFASSLDGWCDEEDDTQALVELKFIGSHMRSEYTAEELPIKFSLQLLQQLAVTGLQKGYLFGMVGTEPILRVVHRHDELISIAHAKAEQFLELVRTKTQPEVDGKEATTKALTIYAGEVELNKIVALPPEFDGYDERLAELLEAEKAAKEESTLLKNRVRQIMGSAEYGYLPSGATFSWKGATRTFRKVKAPPQVRLHQLASNGS